MFNFEDTNIKDVKKMDDVNLLPTLKLKVQFVMTDNVMKELNIPTMKLQYEGKDMNEIWTYCKFDKAVKQYEKNRRYLVSTYGRIYDIKQGKIIKPFNSSMKASSVTGGKYQIINISFSKDCHLPRAVHRLVALAFLKKKKNKDVVDHIDENPEHNWLWNLQWTDKSGNSNKHNMYVQRQRTGRAVDTTWKYEELVQICTMIAEGHKATYIYNEMLKLTNNDPKIQYERIRTLYKHIMKRGDFHDIAVKCGVEFNSNTLKEKSSYALAQKKKKESNDNEINQNCSD